MNKKFLLVAAAAAAAVASTVSAVEIPRTAGEAVSAVFPAPLVFDFQTKRVQVLNIRPGGTGLARSVEIVIECDVDGFLTCADIGVSFSPKKIVILDNGVGRVKVAVDPFLATGVAKGARIIVKKLHTNGDLVTVFTVPVRVR